MTEKDLKERTKAFARRVLKLIDSLPEAGELTVLMVASRKTMLGRNRESKIQNRN